MTLRHIRLALWIAAAAAMAVSGFLIWSSRNPDAPAALNVQIGGPYTLIDQTGRTVTDRDFADKAQLVFFGFTYCPDVCPTTLARISALLGQLGSDADKLHVLLVSIDPERDTPEALKTYVEAFDNRITGLTGTPDQIAAAANAFRIFYKKVPTDDGNYTMDHSSGVLIFSRSGAFKGLLKIEDSDEALLATLRNLINSP
jgi:protein SCO1